MHSVAYTPKDVLLLMTNIRRATGLVFSHALKNRAVTRDPFFSADVYLPTNFIASEFGLLVEGHKAMYR